VLGPCYRLNPIMTNCDVRMLTVEGMNLVEGLLERTLTSDVALVREACQHIIRAGGKRLRPKVVLLSYQAGGGQDISQAVPLAAAVELLHTASLVHDDINDRSIMRRGQATINARWGNSLALLTGDFLFVKLLGLIAGFDSRVIHLLADSCQILVEGEALQVQVLTRGNDGMTPEVYLRIVKQKTASLFSACAELGGLLAKGGKQQVTALRNYGLNLGMAFQIRDDTLDLTGNGEDPGKPATGDLEQDKMILAALSALVRSARAREVLVPTDSPRPIERLSDAWVLEYALETARKYSDMAKEALSVLPGSEARTALCELAEFAVARNQ